LNHLRAQIASIFLKNARVLVLHLCHHLKEIDMAVPGRTGDETVRRPGTLRRLIRSGAQGVGRLVGRRRRDETIRDIIRERGRRRRG